jgi:hypothetical protein
MTIGEPVPVLANNLTCDVCGHSWKSIEERLPLRCPSVACHTRAWNGPKPQHHVNQRSHASEFKFPAVRKRGRPKMVTNDFELELDQP